MDRTCNLETMVRESIDRPSSQPEEFGEELRAALAATQAKIERAFEDGDKVSARLKKR